MSVSDASTYIRGVPSAKSANNKLFTARRELALRIDKYSQLLQHAGVPVSKAGHILVVLLLSSCMALPLLRIGTDFSALVFITSTFVGLLLAPWLGAARTAERAASEARLLVEKVAKQLAVGETFACALQTAKNEIKVTAFSKELELFSAEVTNGLGNDANLRQISHRAPGIICRTALLALVRFRSQAGDAIESLPRLSSILLRQISLRKSNMKQLVRVQVVLFILLTPLALSVLYLLLTRISAPHVFHREILLGVLLLLISILVVLRMVARVQWELWDA